ncbi:MFS transporter [Gorillibacterium sp. sgz5001074]|uniref:MFS transporter n=1 Tax=Gorillibacterium sp. sgz5001074 TaxID=3446695 RepID=UPI003F66ACD1
MMQGMFRNAAYRKLFVANVTSQLGSTVGNMAFAFYLLDRFAEKPFYATLAELMYSAPTLLVFFIVGVLADRMDRKRICAWSDWIRMLLTMGLFGVLFTDVMPLVFGVLFLRSAVGKFFEPAEAGLVQGVLDPEQYTQAAGLNQMIFGVFMLFGMGLGALAYRYVGIEGAVLLDAASFLVSGLLITACRIREEVRLPNGRTRLAELKLSMVVKDFRDGLAYIFRNKLLLALILGFGIFGFVNGAFAVLPMFTMKYKLSPDHYEQFSSFFAISLGIGVLAGSILGNLVVQKWGYVRVIVAGLLGEVVVGTVLAFTPNVWVYLSATLLLGFLIAPVNVALGGWLPHIIDPAYQGRVNSWIGPVMMLSQSMALGLVAMFYPRWMSLEAVYLGVGGCILVAALLYAATLPKLSAEHETGKAVPAVELATPAAAGVPVEGKGERAWEA